MHKRAGFAWMLLRPSKKQTEGNEPLKVDTEQPHGGERKS